MENTSESTPLDVRRLLAPACVVIRGGSVKWTTTTSIVESIPAVIVSELGLKLEGAQVAASVVTVRGALPEPLHYHNSHVIGLGVLGVGVLRTASRDEPTHESRLEVQAGDLILIPRGALHLFESEEGREFVYVGLEFSDVPIDYQKHRYYA